MASGYIKLHRKLLDNPVVCKDSDHFAVWCFLLLNATHSDIEKVFNGEKIILKKGQLITGRKSISDKFNISESKVQRILKSFEIDLQIEQQTCNKNRLITVLKWHEYQKRERQSKQPVNNKRTTSEQPVNTNKNVKNEKNVRSIYKYSYKEVFSKNLNKAIYDFVEFRKSIKKPMTENAVNLLIEQLGKMTNIESEKIDILKQSIINGWQGIFPLKEQTPRASPKNIVDPLSIKL